MTGDGTNTYTWDAEGRLTTVVNGASVAISTNTYNALGQRVRDQGDGVVNTVTTDEVGNERQTFTDALGRIIEVDEPNSSGSLTVNTCYKYDVLGDLTEVDQGSETRYYQYDMLSRLTQSATPESQGNWRYFYYTTSGGALCSGNPKAVCRRTDERGITTTYSYNSVNELTGKSYSNGDTSVSYSYNQTSYNGLTISNGKGQRTGMSDASGETAWSYDKMGRVVEEERKIGSVTKTLSYSYNLDGSLATVTYPSGRKVTYIPSAVGLPVSAEDTADSIDYVTNAKYSPQGTLAAADYGSSINYSIGYDPNRMWPNDLKGTASSTFFELKPTYNYNNTVSGVTNAVTGMSGRTQTFTYDDLNRIITGKSTATSGIYCWGQSIPTDGTGYDRYGNLLKINSSQCSTPGLNVSVNAYNQISTSGYQYDAAGDMLNDLTNTYTWNGEMQLTSAAGVTYTYDGDGKRVEKSSGTYYWFSPSGTILAETDTSGNTQNEYIYFSNGRVARDYYNSTNQTWSQYYYFGDQIGSEQLITNATGTVCYDSDYTPFGYQMAYTTSCPQNYNFADMELDSETGNYHTWFRYYEPNLGRWMSPDLLAGDPTNPQSLNRYSYVLNDPTSFTDPSGLSCENVVPPASLASCVYGTIMQNYPAFAAYAQEMETMGQFDPFEWESVEVSWTETVWVDTRGQGLTQENGEPLLGYWGTQTYNLPVWMFMLVMAQPSGPGKTPANNGQNQQKSPARQQCEANAEKQYQDTFDAVDKRFFPKAGMSGLTGILWGGVAGCVVTLEIGCAEGGLPGLVIGGLAGASKSMWEDLGSVGLAYYQENEQLKACEAIP